MERDDPTPEQIAERCEEVQRTWSKGTERYRRTGLPAEAYDGVETKVVELPAELRGAVEWQE
jgi:hypothetical protein